MAALAFLARRGIMPLSDSETRDLDEVADYLNVETAQLRAENKRGTRGTNGRP